MHLSIERKSSIRGGTEREGERDFRGFEAMQIERKSSIEKEPRTLSFHQIQNAREAALYVIKNKSIEEAFRIFTEGLEPVVRGGHEKMTVMESEDEEHDSFTACLNLPRLRDVVTAPF